ARAFWVREPGIGEIRQCFVEYNDADEVLVETTYSAVSRGTETLVFTGRVPPSQYDVMRAPFQEGEFGGPVKYGYLNVGVVREGPVHLVGRTVFCLRSEEHTSELQSRENLVCRLLLEKKKLT